MEKELLNKISSIYSISNDEIELLVSYMSSVSYSKGEFIVREGERNQNLYIIKSGVVRSFKNYDGEEEIGRAHV